jgi:hypothetical protein
MKNIIAIIMGGLFLFTSVFADSTNVGLKLGSSTMEASGTSTDNDAATINHAAKEGDFTLPSIFVERQFDGSGAFSFAVGLDLVPMTAEIEKLGGGDGFDTTLSAENLVTGYIQPMYSVSDKMTVYGKVGYSYGDLEFTDIKRQASTGTKGPASTDKPSKALQGTMFGIGVQMNSDASGLFNAVRFEATHTNFDEIKHTNSNSKKLTADAEMDVLSFQLVKSF